jgi:hypothetical protein
MQRWKVDYAEFLSEECRSFLGYSFWVDKNSKGFLR